jgi:hypothetical protein
MIQAKSGDVEFIQSIENSKFNGFIHSIFEKTINIKCSDTGDLYTLSCNRLDNGPNSIVIELNSFKNTNLVLNDHVFTDNSVLFIENKMSITIEHVEKWESTLPTYPADDETLKVNVAIMREHINKHGKCGGMKRDTQAKGVFEVEMSNMLEKRSQSLLCEIENNRMTDASKYAVELIGLGPGLTPSGDDFLVGLFTTFNIPNCPCQSFGDFCEKIVKTAKPLTNEISYMTLKKASIGNVRESIISLIYHALYGSEAELISSLNKVLTIGSSSGTDIAQGIVSGLEVNIKIKNRF